MRGPVLVIDSGSPVVSVALGDVERVWAARTLDLRRSSELLLRSVEEVLGEGGTTLAELAGVVALQGPGSFTGLRVGLGTVLGFHQALRVPATALPTLPVLARAAGEGGEVVAAVDALRGDWFVQRFRPGRPPAAAGDAGLAAGPDVGSPAPCRVVGFGVGALAGSVADGVALIEAPPLAAVALELVDGLDWDPGRLTRPIYFRPPAVSLPKTAKRVLSDP